MTTISVFGDSLVYGMGDSKEGGWVSRLQEKLKDDVIFWNFGIPGDTSQDLLGRMKDELESKRTDIVIIFIGANDSQYKEDTQDTLIKLEQYRENLNEIVKEIKKYTDEIIFIGLPRMDESITTSWKYIYHFSNSNLEKYDEVIKEFTKENNFHYLEISNLIEKEDLDDGAHPNSTGYQKITERVENFLIKNDLI